MKKEENFNLETSIAIVGMDGRFPGANNLAEFWKNIQQGKESITHLTKEELLASNIDGSVINNPNYVKAGAFLEDIDLFDANFFGYAPQEASAIDPQHRLFLESAYSALEIAGYNTQKYPGKISVFAGVGWNNYLLFNLNPNEDFFQTALGYQTVIGNDKDFLTSRISYLLNLKGISLDVQTACSTSLVAISMACQSLLTYQSDIALAGGVSIASLKKTGYLYQEGGILSPDGHCRAFDAEAQGTVPGSGVGVVILKRLEDALTDGDNIEAIIRASAINNDGSEKIGYTAPSIDGQAEVIAEALALAEIEPETISYLETHGTGTALGDPIEIAALNQVFRTDVNDRGHCALGSVKTNVGHLDAAAGVTGLIKTVLALKHKQIPPSLHFQQPNPKIDFAQSPFYVNTELKEWKTPGYPRRAGVSSFGIGGTNAHVVLEEAISLYPSSKNGEKQKNEDCLLVISAKTESALDTATNNLVEHLNNHPELDLADVAHTLQVGRAEFNYRRMVVGKDLEDVAIALQTKNPERVLTYYPQQERQSLVFMFSGQGSQYVNMGKKLYETEPVFREWLDRCSELLEPELGLDLRSLIYPEDEELDTASETLKQTQVAQPAIFTIEYALAQLWMSWGIKPEAAIGHSIGEYVAATIAGVFSLEDALRLVALRGKLMQQMPTGSMLAVYLPEAEVKELLNDELSLAAINAPSLCVISGSDEAIAKIHQELDKKEIKCRQLHTSHAFHSPMMDDAIAPLTQAITQIKLNPPQIPFISNVTGTWITAEEAINPNYWAKHMRQTVCFAAGIAELLQEKDRILLEVGAGRTLSTLVRRNSNEIVEQTVLSSLPHPQDKVSDRAFILNTLGKLWLAGVEIDWSYFSAHEQRYRVPLPTYPFERQSYWLEPVDTPTVASRGKKANLDDWFYLPTWKALPLLKTNHLTQNSYLIFVDESGFGDRLIEKLRQNGQEAIAVYQGDSFRQDRDRYTVNPNKSEDYQALWKTLSQSGNLPHKIIDLWHISPTSQLTQSFWHLIYLAQAIEQPEHNLEIIVATNNYYDVIGDETVSYDAATALGAIKVIPQEYAYLDCRQIDLAVSESNRNLVLEQLIAELTTDSPDKYVAYRRHRRWVQTFEPIPITKNTPEQSRLRSQGVYLITGGMEKAIAKSLDRFGTIDGVIHAAGVAGGGIIQLKTPDLAEAVFAPKITGTLILDEVLREIDLDFLVLCSSQSSIVGGFGQSDYCAANAFLDAFANCDRSDRYTVAINWDAWQEVGMAVDTDVPSEMQQWRGDNLQDKLLSTEAIAIFERILASDLSQVIVSTQNLAVEIEQNNNFLATYTAKQAHASSSSLSPNYIAPRNQNEQTIANIWQEVIGLEKIGIHDNFFELGGHSLLAVQVTSRLRKSFKLEIPLQTALFEAPTIAELATAIASAQVSKDELESQPGIRKFSRNRELPLSYNQRRLWFLDKIEPNSSAYNFTNALHLKGRLKVAALEDSINEIVKRHEVIRTYFAVREGQARQKIVDNLEISLPVIDLQNLSATEAQAEVKRLELADARQPFKMTEAPLLRLTLIRLKTTEYILLITMHHIISDAWSTGIFIQELSLLYKAFSTSKASPLTELPIQYADYAIWEQESLQPEKLQTQIAYWKQQLNGAKTTLELPTDKPRSQLQTALGTKHYFTLAPELAAALKTLSQQQGVTLFMTLLAGYNTLLYHYTKQEDITIGSPIANRNHSETEGLIGFFANTIVLRSNLAKNPSFQELLHQVKEVALGAYAHQDVPFEKLVTELQVERISNSSPLFQVWFLLQNTPQSTLELAGLNLSTTDIDSGMVRHDLNLNLLETAEAITGFFEYKTELFNANTITEMATLWQTLLTTVVKQPNITLQELTTILGKSQKEQQAIENKEFKQARLQKLGKIARKKATGIK